MPTLMVMPQQNTAMLIEYPIPCSLISCASVSSAFYIEYCQIFCRPTALKELSNKFKIADTVQTTNRTTRNIAHQTLRIYPVVEGTS